MQLSEQLAYTFEQIRNTSDRTIADLDRDGLVWRPDAEANSIAWLVWHLWRVADYHVAEIAESEQVWVEQGWAERFGLPSGYRDHGYGHTPQQVAAIAPAGAEPLLDYAREVEGLVARCLSGLEEADYDRVVDRRYDPPVTVGVRLASVVGDAWQHVGQAAYVRGLYERRRP